MTEAPYFQLTAAETAQRLKTNLAAGLSADEVSARAAKYGPNVLKGKPPVSPWVILWGQFQDFLIIILIVAAVVSILLGERTDGFLIMAIVVAVAVVGFLNEYKAERTIEALKQLVSLKTKVLRAGQVNEIDTKDLVPGDVVILDEGQKIPADIRLAEVIALQLNEASLTGESQPVAKTLAEIGGEAALADRTNMVFAGTNITAGRGQGVVVATGQTTEIGRIATLVEEAPDSETPLQQKLDQLGKQLGWAILGICAVVFVVVFWLDNDLTALPLLKRLTFAFIASVALAVAAIPEGLAFVVRISLALGARRMAKRRALIRSLPAVEALGSTDTICSDKTGTLTRGEMTVRQLWSDGRLLEIGGSGYSAADGQITLDGQPAQLSEADKLVLLIGRLCNNATVQDGKVIGDPTEGALLVSAAKAKVLSEGYERAAEVPFTSARKLMTTLNLRSDGTNLVTAKGAVEVILEHCDRIWWQGKIAALTPEIKHQVLEQDRVMAAAALRVLGQAYKEAQAGLTPAELEAKLIFAGMQGMMDPPRAEIKPTIAQITGQAGLKVIMITGDHVETAKAVAAEIGLSGDAITGKELDRLEQAEFERMVERLAVYARVSPEHKIRIVQALKAHGHQVAMTGDGVNDAPAIKAADIGIAMGITGTDVAKETADVILLDDHFNTIVNAVEEGRGIYDNIRKFVNYLLSCNLAEVLIVLGGIVIFNKLPLIAVQLLFINMVTDGLPAVALGSDPAERGIMNRRPRHFQESIINRALWMEMAIYGCLMTASVLIPFWFNYHQAGLDRAVAVAFTATVVLELVRLINLRSDYRIGWLSNPWLIFAVLSSLGLQLAVVYIPSLSRFFAAAGVAGVDWLVMLVAATVMFGAMKLVKTALAHASVDKHKQLA